MQKYLMYLPLSLAGILTALCIGIIHSIFAARHPMSEVSWLSYGLEAFVFVVFALGIFVVGTMQQDFCESVDTDDRRQETVTTTHSMEFFR
jgi:ABC-type dipeptide/oligopeptide/nickel transport system permease component